MASKKQKTYVWKDPSTLTRAVLIVLWVNLAVITASLANTLIFGDAAQYDEYAMDWSGPQAAQLALDLLEFVMLLVCLIVPFWIVRMSRNAHSFRPDMKHSPIGAIGWYIVPIANLIVPYEAMEEIWDVSGQGGKRRSGKLVGWWWGIYLVSNIASVVAAIPALAAGLAPALAVAGVLSIANSLLFITLVRRLTVMQKETHQALVFSDPPEAPAGVLEAVTT